MIKRILPIYHSGWFYLILLFWMACYWIVSTGGLNQTNQINLDLLNKITSTQTSTQQNSAVATTDILTLQSSFNDNELDDINSLLLYYPNSQVTFLGDYSDEFISKLEGHLSIANRKQKVILASNKTYSAQAVKVKSAMLFSTALNWLRYPTNPPIKIANSQYIIYAPMLLNQRQSFPLLWQHNGEIYLSLLGEMFRQLSVNNEISLNQHWQLSLTNEQNTLIPKQLTLGFFADAFISGAAYNINQSIFNTQNNRYYFDSLDESLINSEDYPLVSQFIKQQDSAQTMPAHQYKAIIITDNTSYEGKMLKPLLIKISKGDYIYQNLITILLCWILAAIGFGMLWFIRRLSFTLQLIFIMSYCFILFAIQYFIFKQQQWLEILPVIISVTGTWLLLLAYQKEYHLFLTAFAHQEGDKKASPLTPLASTNAKVVSKEQGYKSPQNFTPSSTAKLNIATLDNAKIQPKVKPMRSAVEDLEPTQVIVESPVPSQATMSHHLTIKSFGRYQVEGILGKGAMGVVYQGVDPKINRHVAIKTLQLSDDIDSAEFIEAKDRFFREAQTAGGLSHANIVTIYDVGDENALGYIAMDLLTGAPLSLFTQAEQLLPVPLVYQLLIQITDALDYAHKQNVVHRDIKPANIIYDDDLLKVTVTDFGIAYVSDNSKTRTGIIMGSPYYMSPEQILGLKVDGRSDIFSLGVTFYQLLCGNLPFEGESIATVAYQITQAKAEAVNRRNTKLPMSALRITAKAMHKDIEKRFQSMAEFKLALIKALKRDFKISKS